MRRRWLIGAGMAAGLAAIAYFALASAAGMRAGEDVGVTGTFDQLLFAAGDDVRLAVTATDDVHAAGGNVTIDGSVLDHIFAAGRDIAFQNTTARDLFAAGADIDLITGEVSDDLIAAAGRLRLTSELRVGDDAVLPGGRLLIDAPIGGDLRAAGGRIELNSTVGGDVRLDGDVIVIGPNARIEGAFAALWPLAIVGAVYAGAMLVRTRTRSGAAAPSLGERALWAGLAMIVFVLLGLIPVLGFLLWLAAYVFGLGAVAWSLAAALSKPAQA